MRLADLVAVSRAVGATSGRLEKIGHLADLLKRTPPDHVPTVIAFLSGSTRQGRIGIGGATLSGMRGVPPASEPRLDLSEVEAAFDRVVAASGAGSASVRAQLLSDLFARATSD